MAAQTAGANHPYFPQDAFIGNYEANTSPLCLLLGQFVGLIVVFVGSGLYTAKKTNPNLRRGERIAISWFLLCFFLHAFFEGYFVLYHASLAGSQSLFAQLWKEYALSDSRYMTSDPFMLCIESLTVLLWAPICLAIVVNMVRGRRMRVPLQIIMCVGHLFGVALYYGTCYFEQNYWDISHSRPEFLYYWVYYLGLNAAWVVVPAYYLKEGIRVFLAEGDVIDVLVEQLRVSKADKKTEEAACKEEETSVMRSRNCSG